MKKSQDRWWSSLKNMFIPASAIIIFFGAYHTFNSIIDNKIEKAVNSEAFVKKVQTGVRPFLIFDARGKVLIDLGALEHIDPPVIISTKDNPIPKKVIVTPKEYMAHAPLITGIDQVAVVFEVRGQGLTWEYTFEATYVMTGDVDPETQLQKRSRFRLEIMK